MFSFTLRKHLEGFHVLPLLCISFFINAQAHILYTSFSCLHNFPNLKKCLVLLLQSFVSSTLYSSMQYVLKIIIELLIHKSLFVSKDRPQLKLRYNEVVTKRKEIFILQRVYVQFPIER